MKIIFPNAGKTLRNMPISKNLRRKSSSVRNTAAYLEKPHRLIKQMLRSKNRCPKKPTIQTRAKRKITNPTRKKIRNSRSNNQMVSRRNRLSRLFPI